MKLKHLKISLLLVAVTVVFIGCSKDDEPTVPNPLVGVWGYIEIETDVFTAGTYTYNSNWTFNHNLLKEHNGSVIMQLNASGTYSIHDKDKVTYHITYYDNNIDDPNVEYYQTVRFRKGQDEKGEYLVFTFDILGDSEKLYKKKN